MGLLRGQLEHAPQTTAFKGDPLLEQALQDAMNTEDDDFFTEARMMAYFQRVVEQDILTNKRAGMSEQGTVPARSDGLPADNDDV